MSRSTRKRSFAPVFAALGDDTRLALVSRLSDGRAHSIAQLTQRTRLTRQAVTKHLKVLERASIVRNVRSGRESLFELDPAPIRDAGDYARFVSSQWDEALSRLRTLVENE